MLKGKLTIPEECQRNYKHMTINLQIDANDSEIFYL